MTRGPKPRFPRSLYVELIQQGVPAKHVAALLGVHVETVYANLRAEAWERTEYEGRGTGVSTRYVRALARAVA